MMTFLQAIVLLTMILLLSQTFLRWRKDKLSLFSFLFWSASWIGVLVMSFVPGLLTSISTFTGTNPRDLAVHLALVFLFILYFKFDNVLNKQNANLIEIRKMIMNNEVK